MSKRATNIDEQISLLIERGLDIGDQAKTEEYLMDIGYYRLGFYWYYFQEDKINHKFRPGIKLEDVIRLYYFDMDLRNILSKYLYRIEVHFRTQLVYHVSNHYRESPTWFNDRHVVSEDFINNKLPFIYNNMFRDKNITIKRHHKKYINDRYAPAWKTLEFFTFGQIFSLFRSLKEVILKEKIASLYGIKNVGVFENYIGALIRIRNICSHSAVLFGYRQPVGIKKIPEFGQVTHGRNRSDLTTSLVLILFMLSKVSKNRCEELRIALNALFASMSTNPTFLEVMAREKINIQKLEKI